MRVKSLSVLLVENDLEEIRLIEEALVELEELQFSRAWLQAAELIHAEQLAETLQILRNEPIDVVLLDLSLPDGDGTHAFLSIQEQAPETPIIILAGDSDEEQAIGLVRLGAQDYILKSEVDCIPLARTMRCSIERHRVRGALRSLSFLDDLTGLFAESGFHRLARRYLHTAERLRLPVELLLIELKGLDEIREIHGPQERDMALVLTAELLNRIFDETDIVGRVAPDRFACMRCGGSQPEADQVRQRILKGVQAINSRSATTMMFPRHPGVAAPDVPPHDPVVPAACHLRPRIGVAVIASNCNVDDALDAAEKSLCENRRSAAATSE